MRSLVPAALLLAACAPAEAPVPREPPRSADEGYRLGVPDVDASHEAPDQGHLSVICLPGCTNVDVDGASLGRSPIFRRALATGLHRVALECPGEKKVLTLSVASSTVVRETCGVGVGRVVPLPPVPFDAGWPPPQSKRP